MSQKLSLIVSRLASLSLRGQTGLSAQQFNAFQRHGSFGLQNIRTISTSKKPKETIAPAITKTPVPEKAEDSEKKLRHWVSTGFSYESEELDKLYRNHTFFWMVTVALVGSGFIWWNIPDVRFKMWAQREAYIEIARREALGLPHVDPNLVPLENIVLPSEEELGDHEIII